MINDITIKNYRAFANFEVDKIARVNLIVGANNAGKTSLLEAIFLLESQDPIGGISRILDARGEVDRTVELSGSRIKNYPISHLFYNHLVEDGKSILIENHTHPRKSLQVEVSDSGQNNGLAHVQPQSWSEDEIAKSVYQIMLKRKPSDARERDQILVTEDGLWNGQSLRAVRSIESLVKFVPTNHLDSVDLARMWDKVSLTPAEDQVVEALKILEPKAERLSFQSQVSANSGIIVKMSDQPKPVPLGSMGEGMRRILTIAMSLVSVNNGTLLIDEIDTGLYYNTLVDMWRLVIETAIKQDAQVFATTHSWDCVRAFQEALQLTSDKNAGCLLRLDKVANDITATRYTPDELKIAVSQAIEVR